MKRKVRILVVNPGLPRPDQSAGDRRLFEILNLLAKKYAIDLYLTSDTEESSAEELNGDEAYVRLYQEVGITILSRKDLAFDRLLVRRAYDIAWFEFWFPAEWMIAVIRQFQPWVKIIIDTVDVHFLREEAGLKLGVSNPELVEDNKRRELASYRQTNALIVVTAEDRDALEAFETMPHNYLIPVIVPIRVRNDRDRGRNVLFVGGFKHYPNVDGILWFVNDVWPLIRAGSPDATLTVVGSHVPASVMDLARVEGVEVVGYVPEMEPYLDRAAVSVAPLRFGAGMKGKVVEAMASGLAVVTTEVGAQGLGAISGRDLIIADTPEAFASGVVELLTDPNRAEIMGRSGRELVASICSPEAVGVELDRIIAKVVDQGRPTVPPLRWLFRAIRDRIRASRISSPNRASGDRRRVQTDAIS